MGPDICTKCGQLQKQLFSSFYCDCAQIETKTDFSLCNHGLPKNRSCRECAAEWSSIVVGTKPVPTNARTYGSSVVNPPIFLGKTMTHWLACFSCGFEALYIDHNPLDLSRIHDIIDEKNGFFQKNHIIGTNPVLLCDSCGIQIPSSEYQARYIRQY